MTLTEDLARLQQTVREKDQKINDLQVVVDRHEEQINGERGISAAINAQTGEIRSLRRAAYWVAGLIMAGSISFAFSVLTVFHG